MKSSLLMSVIIAAFAVPAFAQTPVQQVKQDNHAVRQDVREVHQDQRSVAVDQQQLARQHQEVVALGRAEDRAVQHGNLAGAQRIDAKRVHEKRVAHHTARVLRHEHQLARADRHALAHDVQARNRDAAAIH